jgi:hypothetical protein
VNNTPNNFKIKSFGKVPVLQCRESEDSDERILYESMIYTLRFYQINMIMKLDYYPDPNCDMWLEIEIHYLN